MSQFIDKMERKFGRYAIRNLMLYISILYALGYVIMTIAPTFYYQYLSLNFAAIFRGQIWRLVTFIIYPTDTNLIFLIISLYFYNFLGRTLENIWGAFKFNLYYFTGLILTILASMIIYLVTGDAWLMGTQYLNMSIFMAFAVTIPDMQVLLMFLIPIKVKWLAYLDGALLAVDFVRGLINGQYGTCFSIVVCFLNFFIFFFAFMRRSYSPKQFIRRQQFKKAAQRGYQSTGSYNGNGPAFTGNTGAAQNRGGKKITRHHCAVCGRTELDGDELEFRFCSKCNGNYEYCQDHLYTHTHVQ